MAKNWHFQNAMYLFFDQHFNDPESAAIEFSEKLFETMEFLFPERKNDEAIRLLRKNYIKRFTDQLTKSIKKKIDENRIN